MKRRMLAAAGALALIGLGGCASGDSTDRAGSTTTSTTVVGTTTTAPSTPTTINGGNGIAGASSDMQPNGAAQCTLVMEPTDIKRNDRPGWSSSHWFANCRRGKKFEFRAAPGQYVVVSAWNPDTNVAYNSTNSVSEGTCSDGTKLSKEEKTQERGLMTMWITTRWPAPMPVECTVTYTLAESQPLFFFTVVEAPTLHVDGQLES